MANSPLFNLPLLQVGQAGKEISHNEAIYAMESLILGRARAFASSPSDVNMPQSGDIILINNTASGDWSGRENMIAVFDGAGWFFLTPPAGIRLFVESEGCFYTYNNGWQNAPELAETAASAVQDSALRTRVDALCAILADNGLLRLVNAP